MDNDNHNRRCTVTAYEILLRATAFCVTLLATLLTSVDNEKYTFIVTVDCWIMKISNVIVCFYLEASLMLSVIYHIKKVQTEFPIFLPFDILPAAMMFSSATVTVLNGREDIYTMGYSILLTYLGSFLLLCIMYATLSHAKRV